MNPLRTLLSCATLVSALLIQPALTAKTEEWKDSQGKKFKGEPTEIYGPFAIFRTGKYTGRRVLLQTLPPAECVRVEALLRDHPPLASDWSQSRSVIVRDLTNSVMKLEGEKFVPASLAGRPEPRFLVVVYCNQGDGKSWETLDEVQKIAPKIQASHPGKVEFLYYGLKHKLKDHKSMASAKRLNWLLSDYERQGSMDLFNNLAPGEEGYGILMLSSDGVPLFQETPDNAVSAAKFCNNLLGFLDLGLPENHLAWKDRAHYLRATLPTLHAKDSCPPTLVGNPLSTQALQQNGIKSLRARLIIGASGSVESVALNPDSIPEALRVPISTALKQCLLVPAIEKGEFVAGSYELKLDLN